MAGALPLRPIASCTGGAKHFIGRTLIESGLITPEALHHALKLQRHSGEMLGRLLVGEGKISYYHFYQALARHYGCAFANLLQEPCDPALLNALERGSYLRLGAMPWKCKDKKTILAVTEINGEVERWASAHYGDSYLFAITSPYDIYRSLRRHFGDHYTEEATLMLWKKEPRHSARRIFSLPMTACLLALVSVMLMTVLYFGMVINALFLGINIFFLLTLAFKLLFFLTGAQLRQETPRHSTKTCNNSEIRYDALPLYTILRPLYQEGGETLRQLTSAIRRLDYPKSRLDVKLIVEADDGGTIAAVERLSCESYFEIIQVPFSLPRTKPKACNYALSFARGEFITIYDAEDIPDPAQLKKALAAFRAGGEKLGCVQARLNYYNAGENILTRLFALEYAAWFEFMLYGLQALGIPIPLGGTSNHFPARVLRKLYAWDPFNVTEDADLGIRLAQKGYITRILDSDTMEEAPNSVGPWLRQRTRWIKGYLQTYLVHMRHPVSLYRRMGPSGFLGFQFFIGAPCLAYLLVPGILLVALTAYSADVKLFSDEILYLAFLNMAYGVLLHLYFALEVIRKMRWWHLLHYSLAFPFYWLLHSLASFRALWQLCTRPHFWEKTPHGKSCLTLDNSLLIG